LFGWHDGYDRNAWSEWSGPGQSFLTLDQAVTQYEFIHQPDFIDVLLTVGEIAHLDWFPIIDLHEAAWVVIDCHAGSDSWGRLAGYDPVDGIGHYRPALTEPLERWVGYLERRAWKRDAEGRWTHELEDDSIETYIAQGNLP
jgi:hypothetical protein